MRGERFWPLVVWACGLLVCIGIIGHAAFNTDLSAFLPRSPAPAEKVLVEQLREGVASRAVLMGIAGAPPGALAELSRNFSARLRQDRHFAAINNGEDIHQDRDRAFLWDHRYLLSDQMTPDHFSVASLHAALEADLALLASDAAPLLKNYLPNDPTGEMLHLFDTAQASSPPLKEDGVWFAPGRTRAVLVAQIATSPTDLDAEQGVLAIIADAFGAARQQIPRASTARLVTTGAPVFSVAIRDRIKHDAERLSLLAILLVAGVLLMAYRSPRLLLFGLIPVVSGALVGIAAVSLIFGSVHGITLGFGVTLIGEAVDYPIYLFTQTAAGTSPRATLPRIWPTLRLGALTSICGFGALLFSSFAGLAQLGLFSIAGLVTALCVTRWILPQLLPQDFRTPRGIVAGQRLRAMISSAPKLRWPALVLVTAALLILVFKGATLWDNELASLSPLSNLEKSVDQKLRDQLGAPDAGYMVVINRPDREAALEASETVGAILQHLVARRALKGFESPSRYWPSDSVQRQRQAAIPPRDELTKRLAMAVANTPFRPNLFTPFLNQASAAKTQELIGSGNIAGTSFDEIAHTLLSRQGTGWQALLPLRDVRDPNQVARRISAIPASGIVFLDIKQASDALYRRYLGQSLLLCSFGALAVLAFLWLALKEPLRVVRVVMPMAAAVLVASMFLVLLGQKLSIFHLVGLLLTVAVGSNYSLFFERQSGRDDGYTNVITSLLLANLCTVVGFGVLALSSIPVLHGIGTTVAVGTLLSLVFSTIFTAGPDREAVP